MIAVLTGDIIGSRSDTSAKWLEALKGKLNHFGSSPRAWEIYRGDEFQLEVRNPENALLTALQIKACIKTFKNLDVRMAIGLGDKTYQGSQVSQSNGSAFIHSGTAFNSLKKQKVTLSISSGQKEFDLEINLMLKLALVTMDSWSVVSAELAEIIFADPNLLQKEIGEKLNIKQGAVSQRANRAQLDLIMEFIDYYQNKVKTLPRI